MSWIYNAINVFRTKIGSVISSSHDIIGLGKKYRINQDQKDVPFEQGYAKSSDVYSIINKIVSAAVTVPWVLALQKGDKEEVVKEGELYDILQNPNPEQTRMQYVEQALTERLLGGNNYMTSLIGVGLTTTALSANTCGVRLPTRMAWS